MNKFIKSPMNYTGGKHKLLTQIIPLFPKDINVFVDLFCGGGDVFINVDAKQTIANDILPEIILLYEHWLDKYDCEKIIDNLRTIVKANSLSRNNSEAYYKFRDMYNTPTSSNYNFSDMFFLLICHSFSNQIRFNKQLEFNLPFGKRTLNESTIVNLERFLNKLNKLNIGFTNKDFRELDLSNMTEKDFLYIDSPYSLGTATYNECGKWTENDDIDLFMLCDELTKNGVRWAMSNVTHHKGKENELLTEFVKMYNVHEIKSDYNNCNYQQDNIRHTTREILVTNYRCWW
jgi:DNA adenine methylase Dam